MLRAPGPREQDTRSQARIPLCVRLVYAAILLALAGPTAIAVASGGGAQAPRPGSASVPAAAGGGASAPTDETPGSEPSPVTTPAPPAARGGGAPAPATPPAAPVADPAPEAPQPPAQPPAAEDAPAVPPAPAPGMGPIPAVSPALAPPSEIGTGRDLVQVSANPLRPVRELAQNRDRQPGDGGVDIEVPVPGAGSEPAPDTTPPPAAEAFDGLPRTGLEVVLVWAAGVALLAGGLALRAVTRRRPAV